MILLTANQYQKLNEIPCPSCGQELEEFGKDYYADVRQEMTGEGNIEVWRDCFQCKKGAGYQWKIITYFICEDLERVALEREVNEAIQIGWGLHCSPALGRNGRIMQAMISMGWTPC